MGDGRQHLWHLGPDRFDRRQRNCRRVLVDDATIENEGTSKLTHTVTDGPSTFDIKID
jgi:hypothetical protein